MCGTNIKRDKKWKYIQPKKPKTIDGTFDTPPRGPVYRDITKDGNWESTGPKLIDWETRPWDSDTYDCDEESEC